MTVTFLMNAFIDNFNGFSISDRRRYISYIEFLIISHITKGNSKDVIFLCQV